MRWTKVREEHGVDTIGRHPRSLKQARDNSRWRKPRVNQDVPVAGPHERRRRVWRAPRVGLVPQTVAAQRPDADDVQSYGRHARRAYGDRVESGSVSVKLLSPSKPKDPSHRAASTASGVCGASGEVEPRYSNILENIRIASGTDARRVATAIVVALLVGGCAGTATSRAQRVENTVSFQPWPDAGRGGLIARTDNYLIHTTIHDRQLLRTLAKVMEGALAQYRQFTPGVR